MAVDVLDNVPERARRFAARLRGEYEPSFAELVDPPAWKEMVKVQRSDMAVTMALLNARPAIDTELNGQKLAALADYVGEDRFDCVCEADVPIFNWGDSNDPLPKPLELLEQGEALLIEAQRSAGAAKLAEVAADILRNDAPEPVL